MADQKGFGNETLRLEMTPNTTQPSEEGLNQPVGAQVTFCHTAATGCGPCSFPPQELPRCATSDQTSEEVAKPSEYSGKSDDDSEQELSQEDLLVASWDELSILERLGLNSLEMTEDEVERAFTQLALAFRCDQYTLRQRLQAEEHARNLAEENIHLELGRGQDILQSLKALCLDSTRSKILQRLELCLSILGGAVERMVTTAEVLGAVHQEARVSRAMELMVAHVENLKRQHARDRLELEEARRLVQRASRNRQLSDPRDEGEMRQKRTKASQQNPRRRVSIAVISKQLKSQGTECRSSDHDKASLATLSQAPEESQQLDGRQHVSTKEPLSGSGLIQESTDPPLLPRVERPTQSRAEKPGPLYLPSPQDALWQRRGQLRGMKEPHTEEKPEGAPESQHELNGCDKSDDESYTFHSAQRPLASWLSHCHMILFWLYVIIVTFVILLGVFLWSVHGPLFWI